jgi:hypothetical protein
LDPEDGSDISLRKFGRYNPEREMLQTLKMLENTTFSVVSEEYIASIFSVELSPNHTASQPLFIVTAARTSNQSSKMLVQCGIQTPSVVTEWREVNNVLTYTVLRSGSA